MKLQLIDQNNRRPISTNLTLASLFDGIGGFPYAAQQHGIIPTWAAEIEPHCIAITRKYFPDMQHFGDITKIHGGYVPPVDIITFGSPCQDLSVAGKRAGLKGERSSLFNEAIRIIHEMQEVTGYQYPTFAIWENVTGALTSANGLDFRRVIQSFTSSEIPMPNTGRWAAAGMVRGGRTDIAWRIMDARFWGVPQRRRRIFLVADFRGTRAAQILFNPQSLPRHTFEGKGAGQEVTTAANDSSGTSSYGLQRPQRADGRDQNDTAHTKPAAAASICANDNQLKQHNAQHSMVFEHHAQDSRVTECTHISPTVTKKWGTGGNNTPLVAGFHAHASPKANVAYSENLAPTLTAGANGRTSIAYCISENTINRADNQGGNGTGVAADTAYTLTRSSPHAVQMSFGETAYDSYTDTDTAATIKASGGTTGPGGETLIADNPQQQGFFQRSEFGKYTDTDTASTQLSRQYKSATDLIQSGAAVRRLMPIECERLQGFPDNWTQYGVHKNGGDMPIADSKRYQALGNSVAVPCVRYVMAGIVAANDDAQGV